MAHLDRRGFPLSTTSDVAAERYREGVDLLLSASSSAAETLDDAIAADPDFGLARAARARPYAIRGEMGAAEDAIAEAMRHSAGDNPWFLTYRGWSHAENSAVAHGRDLTERDFLLRRENANAAHALSHAMVEDRRPSSRDTRWHGLLAA